MAITPIPLDEAVRTRVERRIDVLNQTIASIKDEADRFDRNSKGQGYLNETFTAVLAILAVAAPALVTYQTQRQNPVMAIVVIVVTALAGAGTALQGVFRWGDRFRRNRLTALELKELLTATNLDKQDIEDSTDDLLKFAQIRALNDKAATRLQAIIRRNIEAEVALVSQPTPPATSPSTQPSAAVQNAHLSAQLDKATAGRVQALDDKSGGK